MEVYSRLKSKHEWILGSDWYLVVCVRSSWCFILRLDDDGTAVIYQQPRPGPKLPMGESYLTIGWKQVRSYLLDTVAFNFELDLGRLEAI